LPYTAGKMNARGERPRPREPQRLYVLAATGLALLAFAGNSLFTRAALGARTIDAATFTAVRLGAGALVLLLVTWRPGVALAPPSPRRRLGGPLALFLYAAPFSIAYLRIDAGVGALVLFGSVQVTMVAVGLARGERPGLRGFFGLLLACAGLLGLTLPGADRPDLVGAVLMAVAGVAWGAYSLLGQGLDRPLSANAWSFALAAPLALLWLGIAAAKAHVAPVGLAYAVLSGGLTSAVGYAIWYRALRGLGALEAAVAQLAVPILAALGGVLFLGEAFAPRLGLAGAAVLGGVGLVLSGRVQKAAPR